MNTDQNAPMEQSDLGPYCLQYRLPKRISRQAEQTTKADIKSCDRQTKCSC